MTKNNMRIYPNSILNGYLVMENASKAIVLKIYIKPKLHGCRQITVIKHPAYFLKKTRNEGYLP